MRPLKLTLATLLTLCLAIFIIKTIHWPLVSDAALIRYATFLLDHGQAPYRQIQDYNLPGAYLADWLVLHTLGASDLAWRVFDLSLLALTGGAMYVIAKPQSRFAAFYAFALFALFHARDGIAHTGQRDLTMTALLLAATALLLHLIPRKPLLALALFGLLIGSAATIKPLALLLIPLPLLVFRNRQITGSSGESQGATTPGAPSSPAALSPAKVGSSGELSGDPERSTFSRSDTEEGAPRPASQTWASTEPTPITNLLLLTLTAALPIAAVLLWIAHHQALQALRFTLFQLIPLHASLGYPGLGYLITRCLTASHLTILVLAAVLAITRPTKDPTRRILIAGVAFGLLSFIAQGKGYPYQRYPFAAFLFLFAAIELTQALQSKTWRRPLALAGLLFGAILAPLYTAHAVKERWPAQPYTGMAADLHRLDTPAAPLSRDVQCLDTISGCIATLNQLHLLPATGLFYDEILFAQPATPAQSATIASVRANFLADLTRRPPRILLITSFLFPRGPDNFAKLDTWPAFSHLLAACYTLETERTFPVPPTDPTRAYRIYQRLPDCKKP